jgi:hypothetical protein
MDAGGESLVLKKFIAGLVGLLGVAPLMQGAVMATDASTDMTGTILIIVGLLLSFGAWRLWPASTSEKIQNSNEQERPHSSAESVPPLQRTSNPGFWFLLSVLFIFFGLVLDDAMASSNPTIGPTNGQLVGILFLLTGGVMFLIAGFLIGRRIAKSLFVKNA